MWPASSTLEHGTAGGFVAGDGVEEVPGQFADPSFLADAAPVTLLQRLLEPGEEFSSQCAGAAVDGPGY